MLGRPEKAEFSEVNENVKIVSHLNSEEMFNAISESEIVLTRPGYSTIMDLAVLCKKAIFIPTPGQTEQEYLAANLLKKKIAFFQKQSEINISNAIKEIDNYHGFQKTDFTNEKLENEIKKMLQ